MKKIYINPGHSDKDPGAVGYEKERDLNVKASAYQRDYLLENYDLVTTKRVILNNSYYHGFSANHNIKALDCTGEVIRDLYPDLYS